MLHSDGDDKRPDSLSKTSCCRTDREGDWPMMRRAGGGGVARLRISQACRLEHGVETRMDQEPLARLSDATQVD